MKVSAGYKIQIPSYVRDQLNIKEGDKMDATFSKVKGTVTFKKVEK